MPRKPKAVSSLKDGVASMSLRLAALEKPEIRAALIKRLTPLLEKAPVLVLHQVCQQLEMLANE